jgi:hypothetical protein
MAKKDKTKGKIKDKTKIKNKNKNKNTIVVNVNSHNKRKTSTHKREENNRPYHAPIMPYVINAASQPQTQPVVIYQPHPAIPLGQTNPIRQPNPIEQGQRLGSIGQPLGYSNLLITPSKTDTEIQTDEVFVKNPEIINALNANIDKLTNKASQFYEDKIYYKNKLIDLENENAILKNNERQINEMYGNVMSGKFTAELPKYKDTHEILNTPKKSASKKKVSSTEKKQELHYNSFDEKSPSFDSTTPNNQFYTSPPSEMSNMSTPIGSNFLSPEAVNFPENIVMKEPLKENPDLTLNLSQDTIEPLNLNNSIFNTSQHLDQLSFHTLHSFSTLNNTLEQHNQSVSSQNNQTVASEESSDKPFEEMTEEDKIRALLKNNSYLDLYQDQYIAKRNREGKLKLYYQSGKLIQPVRIDNLYKKYC